MSKQRSSNHSSTHWQEQSEAMTGRFFERLKAKRVQLFVDKLRLGPDDIVLDLGSEDGSYLAKYYPHPENIVIADIYEEQVDDAVDGLSALLEPLIMSVLGVLVGGLIIAMYLPIFQLGQVV